MKKSKCSQELYCKFLEVTSLRYSSLSLSEVAPEENQISHDSITRWLSSAKVQPKNLWEAASKEITALPAEQKGILAFDDVVINKSRSQKMELVNWQYSGTDKGVVKGIGVVNVITSYALAEIPQKNSKEHSHICII